MLARKRRDVPWLGWRGEIAYVFWYDKGDRKVRRCSLHTADPDEASRAFASFILHGGTETADTRGAFGLSTELALDQYYREHVVPNVVDKGRQEDAIAHLKAHFGSTPIDGIDIPQSRRYADLRRQGVIGGGARTTSAVGANGTIQRELAVLMAAAKHALRWKRIERLPTIERPPEKRLGFDEEAPYFTADELQQLFAAADVKALDPQSHIDIELPWFVNLCYYTGARRRSIEDLERSQVRREQNRIVLQKDGKTSTRKRQPIVPIFPAMVPAVDALLEHGGEKRLFRTADFYRPFRALCESVGLGDRSHPHLLRHSRATHLLQAGKPLYAVARLLGDRPSTIERVYGHHSAEHIARDLEG